MRRVFVITGTDTDVGKTVFAAALTRAIDGCYWKPVQAGSEDGGDAAMVARLSGLPPERILPEVYKLTTPCSPHEAAAIDDVVIDPARLVLPETDRPLIVEGAGGLLVPLNENLLFADLVNRWDEPIIIVARTSLGTINHSLLTIEALRTRNLLIHGLAFVGEANPETERIICRFGEINRLGRLDPIDPLNVDTLARAFAEGFNVQDFIE